MVVGFGYSFLWFFRFSVGWYFYWGYSDSANADGHVFCLFSFLHDLFRFDRALGQSCLMVGLSCLSALAGTCAMATLAAVASEVNCFLVLDSLVLLA